MRVGYIRVSTLDQKTERQLQNVELDKVFIDKCSGKDMKRPELEKMMNFLREGDHLIVDSMDRLSRNNDDMRNITQTLNKRGVKIQFLKENLTITGEGDDHISKFILFVFGWVAEAELARIKERQREGIIIARAKGVYKNRGRDRCLKPDEIIQLKKWVYEGMAKTWIAKQLGISRHSVYNYLKEDKTKDWIEENKKEILLSSIK